MQVSYTSGPLPLHYTPQQGLMTFVPTPQPTAGSLSQVGGPAAGAQHHMMMAQPAAQQHSIHTAVPPQMIIPSQPQPGMQAPPVGGHQYVQAHAIPSNLLYSSLLCDLITHAGVGRGFSRICLSVCLFIHALTGKRIELSTLNLVHIIFHNSRLASIDPEVKRPKSRSHGYENRHCHTIASVHAAVACASVGAHVDSNARVF